jgi:uncharacterized phage protein (TIGR01671 family)
MREILFRGKDIVGNWYEGNLANISTSGCTVKAGSYISNEYGLPFAYQVRPETVGQFTGLTDKVGARIFEGDVYITSPNSLEYEVRFIGGAFCGGLRGANDKAFQPLGWVDDVDFNSESSDVIIDNSISIYAKVIGNIHEQAKEQS